MAGSRRVDGLEVYVWELKARGEEVAAWQINT